MKGKGLLTGVLKKTHMGKLAILGSKIAHSHNSGSTGRIFSKFCPMKGANM